MDAQKNKKMAKFISFLKTVNIFVPEESHVLSEVELEKISIDDKIGKIIDTGNLSSLQLLIEQNVKFSDVNIEKLLYEGDIHQRIFKLDSDTSNKFINDNKTQIIKALINPILNFDKILNFPEKIKNDNSFNDRYKKDHKQLNHVAAIIFTWGTKILKDDSASITTIYETANSIFTKSEKLNLSLKHQIKEITIKKYIIDTLEVLYSKSNKEELIQLANRSRILELADINTIMADAINKKIHIFNPGNLPKEAQNLFKEIRVVCQDLQGYKKQLDTTQILHFDNLYLKRLPNVIQEYITIPEHYRQQLKVNKDNPDDLLVDSLTKIKNSLHEMMMQLQENNIQTMKKTNLYLKSI